jgi:hypothetical protein
MDSFYFNKVAGAVLSGLLLMVGLRTGIEMFYPKGTSATKGETVISSAAHGPGRGPGAAPAETQDPSVDSLLASAKPDAAKAL